ncbi:hypothetical protein IH979_03290 [Patescibacteria group bacterium]|nr:hypothetical protein [Patescibacteria group bacterium]
MGWNLGAGGMSSIDHEQMKFPGGFPDWGWRRAPRRDDRRRRGQPWPLIIILRVAPWRDVLCVIVIKG